MRIEIFDYITGETVARCNTVRFALRILSLSPRLDFEADSMTEVDRALLADFMAGNTLS